MKDAREEDDAGRSGGRAGRREGWEREVIHHREGVYLAHRHLPEVFIVARVIFHRPQAFLGRHVKDEHVKDAAQGVAEGAAEGVP